MFMCVFLTCSYGYKNAFCYICDDFVIKIHQRNSTDFEKFYFVYFVVMIDDKNKCRVPHKMFWCQSSGGHLAENNKFTVLLNKSCIIR